MQLIIEQFPIVIRSLNIGFPTIAAAIRESIMAASEVPAATSISASACVATGVCSSSSADFSGRNHRF